MKHGSLLQKKPCGVALKRNKYVLPRIRVKRLISVDDQRKRQARILRPAVLSDYVFMIAHYRRRKKGELLKP